MDVDFIVIGGGPGGYIAAIRASQLGFNVVVIEKDELGGVCLNWGCIPTKALLNSAHSYYHLKHKIGDFGIMANNVSFDITKIVQYSRKVSKKLSDGISYLMSKNKIKVYKGSATINKDKTVTINGKNKISGKHIIIATGASPRTINDLDFDSKMVWNYRDAMIPSVLPRSAIIVGSGAIGMEFASFYNALGTDVTILEMQKHILPAEDEEISNIAAEEFKKRGVKILTNSKIVDITKSKKHITIQTSEKDVVGECVIVAAGVLGNVNNLGLENFSSIKIEKGHIKVDGYGYTGVEGIYAIGDVAGSPCLAHKASHEGILCVEKIAGLADLQQIDRNNIPGCTYCDPQIASVGLTEKQAKDMGYEVKVGRFKPEGNGKSVVLAEQVGLVKTIFDRKTGELLGAHMIGAEVTEMIQGYVIGKTLEATDKDFKHTIFPHPTLSEMMHESVLDADDEALHS